jgi:hypothetical protein
MQVTCAIFVDPLAANVVWRSHQIREAVHVADRYDALWIEQLEDPS